MSQQVLGDFSGLTASMISMIESGSRSLTRYAHVLAIAAALRVPPSDIVPGMPSDVPAEPARVTVESRRLSRVPGAAGWTTAGTLASAREALEVNPVDRRSFMAITGAAITAAGHEWATASPVADASSPAGRVVDVRVLDDLDEMTARLRRMDDQMGGGALVGLVGAQAAYVAGLIRNGRFGDTTGRRLHGVLGELLRLRGWVLHDGDEYPRAQRSWISALHAAHTAGDTALGANILSFMSVAALDKGHADDAVKLASAALAGYRGGSPRVWAILHIHDARARAVTGDRTNCLRAVDSARESLRASFPASGEPDWSYWIDEDAISDYVGMCFMSLGDFRAASTHFEQSLRDTTQDGAYARAEASRMIWLASARARQDEPKQACAAGTRAVAALAGQIDSPRLAAQVRCLRDDLAPYAGLSAVRDLREQVSLLSA